MINFGVIKSRLIDRYRGQHFLKYRQCKKKYYRFDTWIILEEFYTVKYLVNRKKLYIPGNLENFQIWTIDLLITYMLIIIYKLYIC